MTKKTVLDYQRQQEILFDIAMDVGSAWPKIGLTTRSALIDYLNGSRGLFDLVVSWVEEFDRDWETSPDDPDRNYYESIAAFTASKLKELVESGQSHVDTAAIEKTKKTYLTRCDKHLRRISALEADGAILSGRERHWLVTARQLIVASADLKQVKQLTRAMGVLVDKLIHDRHEAGATYMSLSTILGLSSARTSNLGKNYPRELRSYELRIQGGRETNMPWL